MKTDCPVFKKFLLDVLNGSRADVKKLQEFFGRRLMGPPSKAITPLNIKVN